MIVLLEFEPNRITIYNKHCCNLDFSLTENRVPQNRETREKMRKPRLKKFSNISICVTK